MIGVGSTAVDVWNIAKWPVMVVLVAVMLAILFYWAPSTDYKRFRWISPGSLFAVMIVIVASALFAFYVANFGSYSATYGSLGGIIVFLLWLWIANNGLLLGQELNAELDRARVEETKAAEAPLRPRTRSGAFRLLELPILLPGRAGPAGADAKRSIRPE